MAKRKKTGNSALKKITTKAKALYKKGGSWKAAIKKASAAYRSGSLGATKFIEHGEKKSTPAKKVYRVKRSAKGRFKGYSKVGLIPGTASMTTVNGISAGSIGAMKSAIKANVKQKLANALLRKDLATTKRDKKRIGKDVTAYRRELKKYC